jgi:hypothetical protein
MPRQYSQLFLDKIKQSSEIVDYQALCSEGAPKKKQGQSCWNKRYMPAKERSIQAQLEYKSNYLEKGEYKDSVFSEHRRGLDTRVKATSDQSRISRALE